MLVDGSLGNLIQGVSQQPNRDRSPGQCTAQVNAVADVVDGFKRRPPLEFVGELATVVDDALWYNYDTGLEQYVVRITTTGIRVWDLVGVEQTVTAPDVTYLANCSNEDISLITIGDYTVIASKSTIPAMGTEQTTDVHGALLYFTAAGETQQTFEVWLDDTLYATWDGPGINDTSIPAGAFSVSYAVNELYTQLVASGANTPYEFTLMDSTILVRRRSGVTAINARVNDGHAADRTCRVVQDTIKDIAQLPLRGYPGMIVTVTGGGTDESNDLYLKFEVNTDMPDTFGSLGTWRETTKPGQIVDIDASTMPHVLIRQPDGDFYFGALDGTTHGGHELEHWRKRTAGNDDNVPIPTFIGKAISYLGTFQERMFILAEDTVDFSATDSYFNFFIDSAVTIVDTDPISLRSSDEAITNLTYGLQHNKHLIFFTEFSQYIVKGSVTLTPSNANMPRTTTFETAVGAAPVSGGSVIFFPITYGSYAGVQEFFTDGVTNIEDARAITEHVKRYIPGSMTQLLASPSLGILLCRSTDEPNTVFLYQYLWQQNQRVQSAWGKWEIEGEVRYMFWKGTDLYVCVEWVGDVYLLKLDLTDKPITGLPFNIYLDARVELTPTGNTVTLPYENVPLSKLVAVQGTGCKYPGMTIKITDVTGDVVTLASEPTGTVFVGVKHLSAYTPSMPKILDYKDRVISTDRLNLSKFIISYKDTGNFVVTSKHPHYDDAVEQFTGRIVGDDGNIVGVQPISTGTFRASIGRNTEECVTTIATDSYLPMTLTAIEWIGQYNKRGRRM